MSLAFTTNYIYYPPTTGKEDKIIINRTHHFTRSCVRPSHVCPENGSKSINGIQMYRESHCFCGIFCHPLGDFVNLTIWCVITVLLYNYKYRMIKTCFKIRGASVQMSSVIGTLAWYCTLTWILKRNRILHDVVVDDVLGRWLHVKNCRHLCRLWILDNKYAYFEATDIWK